MSHDDAAGDWLAGLSGCFARVIGHRPLGPAGDCVLPCTKTNSTARGTVPEADLDLPAGTNRPGSPLDITRLRDDTRFEPQYDTAHAAADYIAWLHAGNER